LSEHFFESKIEAGCGFNFCNEVLSLASNISSIIEKLFDFSTDLRDDVYEYKNEQGDKYDIESGDNDICRCIFPSYSMGTIFFSMESPIMYFLRQIGPELEKNISKKEGDEKEHEKVAEAISDDKKSQVSNQLSPKNWTEYHWKC
jgi:hypothetical protein